MPVRHALTALGVGLFALLPPGMAAQTSEQPRLSATTTSAEARAAFWSGLDDIDNIYFPRAARQLQQALSLDPSFGIARVAYGLFAPGLTTEQRDQEINRGVADAAQASTGELLAAMAWRARGAAQAEERRILFQAAADLLPADPRLSYYAAAAVVDQRARERRLAEVARTFPQYGPTFNQLAYLRWTLEDGAGALAAAEQQLKVSANVPNAHDSYAEILQFHGRLDEAAPHYQHAMRMDADYIAAHTGLAEIALLKGDGATARTHYGHAIQKDPVPQNKLNYRQAIAVTYVAEGNVKAAVDEYAAVAAEAERNNYTGVATAAHRNLAVLEAGLGDKATPHGHLARAQELGGDTPTQQVFAALTHAMLGHMTPAKAAAATFAEGGNAPNPTLALRRNIQAVNGVVAAAEGNTAGALESSRQAGQLGALGKALAAEKLKQAGRTAEAQALRQEVMAFPFVDLLTAIAKQRASKV
ncbi:MAG TPA: hypothetical protein VD793_04035 [Gemmatimonadales bacterium]|nr:hypothetical protein [Gemmatimonadales bacterium]